MYGVLSSIVELGSRVLCEFNLGRLSSTGSSPTLIKKSERPRHIGAARFLTTAL